MKGIGSQCGIETMCLVIIIKFEMSEAGSLALEILTFTVMSRLKYRQRLLFLQNARGEICVAAYAWGARIDDRNQFIRGTIKNGLQFSSSLQWKETIMPESSNTSNSIPETLRGGDPELRTSYRSIPI